MNEVSWIQNSGDSVLCHSSKEKAWFLLQTPGTWWDYFNSLPTGLSSFITSPLKKKIFFFSMLYGMWDLSFPSRDQIPAPNSGSTES